MDYLSSLFNISEEKKESPTTTEFDVVYQKEEDKDVKISPTSNKVVDYSSYKKVLALIDHPIPINNELCFEQWEIFYLVDDSDGEYWKAIREKNNEEGIIPAAFFNILEERDDESLEDCDWFFKDINKADAERYLYLNALPGTFLIRKSESQANSFALTVLDYDEQVKHFRINFYRDKGYGISSALTHPSLKSLVEFFKSGNEPQIPRLKKTLQKDAILKLDCNKDMWEVSRQDIEFKKQLGEEKFKPVFLAKFRGKKKVSVKIFKNKDIKTEEFLKEAEIMKSLRHQNVVRVIF